MAVDIGTRFRSLHRRGDPLILCNVWDIGSARVMAALGAKALATSSAAHAFTLGRPDLGQVTRDEALAHAQDIVAATPLPVQGDFENGFGESPETCAETVRLAADVGLAGICIEDTDLPSTDPYARELAVERIRAAAAAARALPADFVLTARADGIMHGSYGLQEAIARLQAFEAAGADCLYAPIPASLDDLAEIVRCVSAPVNVLAAGPYTVHPLSAYAEIGAARISLGSALARATHRVLLDTGSALLGGDFSPLGNTVSGGKVDALLKKDL